jgi:hexosaminidase
VGLQARPLREPEAPRRPRNTLRSHELELCTAHIPLALEDDAPLAGNRATFLVDVQNPCWIARGVRLDRVREIGARVGQVPFNFQIGDDARKIRFPAAETAEGELEARAPGCEGELLARLPLAPALLSQEVSALPPAPIAPRKGTHDVCLRFAQRGLDPLWVIDSVQFRESP